VSNLLLAKERSVAQVLVNVIRIARGVVRLASQLTDPFENFLCVFFAVLAIDLSLYKKRQTINDILLRWIYISDKYFLTYSFFVIDRYIFYRINVDFKAL
jgi:hypothetical protein